MAAICLGHNVLTSKMSYLIAVRKTALGYHSIITTIKTFALVVVKIDLVIEFDEK